MSVPNPHIRFTYDDYQTLPEETGQRHELLNGALIVSPAPTALHQLISANLQSLLHHFVRQHQLGYVLSAPIDVVLGQGSEREVVQPDLLFISTGRRAIITKKEIQGAPELVIEIMSPSSAARDRGYKLTLYGRYGVKEYWLVDPDAHTLGQYLASANGLQPTRVYSEADTLETALLPGLRLALGEVFVTPFGE